MGGRSVLSIQFDNQSLLQFLPLHGISVFRVSIYCLNWTDCHFGRIFHLYAELLHSWSSQILQS